MATFRLPPSKAILEEQARAAARVQMNFAPPTVDFISGSAGSEVSFSLTGFSSVLENIDELGRGYRDAVGYTLEQVLKEVVEAARFEVPFLSGNLWESIGSDHYEPDTSQKLIEMSVWAGAPNPERFGANSAVSAGALSERQAAETGAHKTEVDPAEYARRQHEDLSLNHPHGGKAKFVEDPFLRITATLVERVDETLVDLAMRRKEGLTDSGS